MHTEETAPHRQELPVVTSCKNDRREHRTDAQRKSRRATNGGHTQYNGNAESKHPQRTAGELNLLRKQQGKPPREKSDDCGNEQIPLEGPGGAVRRRVRIYLAACGFAAKWRQPTPLTGEAASGVFALSSLAECRRFVFVPRHIVRRRVFRLHDNSRHTRADPADDFIRDRLRPLRQLVYADWR